MAMVEGRGKVAPAPVTVTITPNEMGVLWQESVRRNARRQYAKRSTQWGRGLTGAKFVPALDREVSGDVFPILAGLVGEWAAYRVLHKSAGEAGGVDTAIRDTGDRGIDLILAGISIQVKCRTTACPLLVRKRQGHRLCPIRSQVFVFCHWQREWAVDVLGTVSRKDVQAWEVRDGKGRGHQNYVGSEADLFPIGRLATAIHVARKTRIF